MRTQSNSYPGLILGAVGYIGSGGLWSTLLLCCRLVQIMWR